jgi:hypothetical protein
MKDARRRREEFPVAMGGTDSSEIQVDAGGSAKGHRLLGIIPYELWLESLRDGIERHGIGPVLAGRELEDETIQANLAVNRQALDLRQRRERLTTEPSGPVSTGKRSRQR